MTKQSIDSNLTRYVLIGGLIVAAFFGAYKFAAARGAQVQSVPVQAASAAPAGASGATAADSVATGNGVAEGNLGAQGSPVAAVPGGASAPSGSCCGGGATAGSSAAAGGCCGGGSGSQAQVSGTAQLSGGVQKIGVKVTTTYTPNVLQLKAGVPAEITFSSAQGCTGIVQSRSLGFAEDLKSGAKTVRLKGLAPGTYDFECGMDMVQGTIVVQ